MSSPSKEPSLGPSTELSPPRSETLSEDPSIQHGRSTETDEVSAPTDEDVRDLLKTADLIKEDGNVQFRASKWEAALALYKQALGHIPPRKPSAQPDIKGKGKERESSQGDGAEEVESSSSVRFEEEEIEVPVVEPLTELEKQCATSRAVLNGNIAACFVKLNETKAAVEACSEALIDDPTYVKALHRRATCNETLGTWSSLSSAQQDYATLEAVLPATSPLLPQVRKALVSIKPRVEEARKKETDEMLGKLKGLGNMVLGKFGLSTDNFKFEPNGQGGYSMNFVQ